jgi:hypothetical protein
MSPVHPASTLGPLVRMFALVALFSIDAVAHAASPFEGTWRLDKKRSELSGGMRENQASIEQSLTISVAGNIVTMKTTTTGGPLGTRTTTDRFEIDGKRRPFVPGVRVDSGNAHGTRASTWLPGKRGFEVTEIVTRDIRGGTFTVHNTHRWSVSGDALTIESTTRGPQGKIYTRRVLTRSAALFRRVREIAHAKLASASSLR